MKDTIKVVKISKDVRNMQRQKEHICNPIDTMRVDSKTQKKEILSTRVKNVRPGERTAFQRDKIPCDKRFLLMRCETFEILVHQ